MSTRLEDKLGPISAQEKVAEQVANGYRKQVDELRAHFGDKPYGQTRMTATEKLVALSKVINDESFWSQSIEEETAIFRLSGDNKPREMLEETSRLYVQYRDILEGNAEPPKGYHLMPDGGLMSDEEMEAGDYDKPPKGPGISTELPPPPPPAPAPPETPGPVGTPVPPTPAPAAPTPPAPTVNIVTPELPPVPPEMMR